MAITAWCHPTVNPTTTWTTPGNALTDDANIAYPGNNTAGFAQDWSEWEDGSANSLDSLITAGATIDGIECRFRCRDNYDSAGAFIEILLSHNGGTNFTLDSETEARMPASGEFANSATVYTSGGATSKYGRTWAQTEFTHANFRVRTEAETTDGYSQDVNIEWLELRVHYTVGGGGGIVPRIMHHRRQMQ